MKALAPALALALALATPVATAIGAADVRMGSEGGVWNGVSRVDLTPQTDTIPIDLWIPAGARIHHVALRPDDAGTAEWYATGSDSIRVVLPPNSTGVAVSFDVADRRPYSIVFRAPAMYDRLWLEVFPAAGQVAETEDARLDERPPSTFHVREDDVAEGRTIAIRVIDAGRVGELPLLLTIGGLSLLVLLGTLAWHRARPPLKGRAPEKFLDHLSELQARLLPPVILFALFNLFYFTSGLRVVDGLPLPTWGVDASISARAFEAIAERLVPPGVQLVVLRPADAVLAQVGMCLFLAFATVLPVFVYEIAAFIGPGLEPRERSAAMRVLPLVTGLFLAGALLAYLVMAPLMIRTLYDYAPGIGAASLLAVGDLVAFALLIILALGIAFELPVLMYVLARLGLVRSRTFGRYVRHAILVIVVLAGLITPDPSVVSQLLLAVPIVALYLLGIGAAAIGERARPPVA